MAKVTIRDKRDREVTLIFDITGEPPRGDCGWTDLLFGHAEVKLGFGKKSKTVDLNEFQVDRLLGDWREQCANHL